MPTISLRVSEEVKSQLTSLAQETGRTVSGVVLDAVTSAVGGKRQKFSEDMAPSSISSVNRLILRNQELILSGDPTLNEDERDAHARNAKILEGGYSSEYSCVFASLRPEIPYGLSEELFDILDMFRVLRASYDILSDKERQEVNERDISFRGFDYNDNTESLLADYVDYLFEDDRYAELRGPLGRYSDDGNSHHRNLDMYRRMKRCFESIWRKHLLTADMLSLKEMKRVVSAMPYDSGY